MILLLIIAAFFLAAKMKTASDATETMAQQATTVPGVPNFKLTIAPRGMNPGISLAGLNEKQSPTSSPSISQMIKSSAAISGGSGSSGSATGSGTGTGGAGFKPATKFLIMSGA